MLSYFAQLLSGSKVMSINVRQYTRCFGLSPYAFINGPRLIEIMIFGPKTLQNCFKDPEMHILSESIGLYPKMKSKWCYLEYFCEKGPSFVKKGPNLLKLLI